MGLLANTIPLADIATGTASHPAPKMIQDGLRERRWIDGENVQLIWRSAEGDLSRLPALAEELVRMPVDVLIGWGPGFVAIAQKTDRIPIIMGASGVVEGGERIRSLARPGGNLTGMTLAVGKELNGKRLALLKQVAPGIRRVAFLSEEPGGFSPETSAAAQTLGLGLQSVGFHGVEGLERAFDTMAREGVHAVIVDEAPITNLAATQRVIHRLAERHRMPVLHQVLSAVESGGLMAYGHDINLLYRRAPYFIDRILRGTKPGDIPIEQPAQFELHINLGAARAIGLTIPPSILVQADRTIK